MKKLTIIAALLVAMSQTITASADVLGNVVGGWSNDMGAYSVFHKTEFDGGSDGRQTEYYVEYTPNEYATPVIADDGSLWGQSNIYTVQDKEESDGYRTVAGINGDFFSFKTGLPMGTAISDGRILTTVSEPQPAIGFRADATAFIDDLQIKTTAVKDGVSADIMCINKWYQNGYDPIYMLTDDFGESTKTDGECLFVICLPIDGELKVNSETTVKVEDSFVYTGEIKIPEGRFVLVIDNAFGMADLKAFMEGLNVNDEFTIKTEAINSKKNMWSEATEATSTTGGRLLQDGVICAVKDGQKAPRTAVGIKNDGNIIMYTLDGRRDGYSRGAQLDVLAERLKELGCVDAINLDGGGSTTMGALLSGEDDFEVLNRPSDEYVRSVANYIFLRDNREPTGVPWIINAANLKDEYYLGDTLTLEYESIYDTNNFKMTDTSDITVTAQNATISADNVITFDNLGEVRIRIFGGIADKEYGFTVHRTYFADIENHWAKNIINNVSDRELINGINQDGVMIFSPDSQMTRTEFAAIACRYLNLDYDEYESATLPFTDASDIQEWAIPAIKAVYANGIMSGKSDDNGVTLRFEPQAPITRAEAMTILSRILDIESFTETAFADNDEIPQWAYEAVNRLVSVGVVKGYNDNTIRPNALITRAEGASMLYNCY